MKGLIFCFWIAIVTMPASAAKLIVLDPGEGLMVAIKTENHSILIDTGTLPNVNANLDFLHSHEIFSITDLFLTHLHADHASGLFEVTHRFPNMNIYDHCMPGVNQHDGDLIRWTDELLSTWEQRFCVESTMSFSFDNIAIDVLWPKKNFNSKDHNKYSLVLRVSSEQQSVLLMADVPESVEETLLSNQREKISGIDVLVVGHHGSGKATSPEFLNTVTPRLAIVPVNIGNVHGYPNEEVIQRLKSKVPEVWITGVDGAKTVKLN